MHIQAEVDHDEDPVAETAWVAELADDALRNGLPGPVACVVYADLRVPTSPRRCRGTSATR